MYSLLRQTSFIKARLINNNYNFFRHLRSIARRDHYGRDIGPKVVKAEVKTLTKYYDDEDRIESYKDFIKSIEGRGLGDEHEVEKQFLNDDYHGDVFERCDNFSEMHESDERSLKLHIKKKIVGRKYFKLDMETNLLTHAAKEQIRFLHKSNPLEWNCKALSECFPISEGGVKKLLKCNFALKCPEKIKEHDEKVAELWKILKSGKLTNLISPLTQKLYKEGKLVDDYFSGNPKLPTAPPSKVVIDIKKKKKVGEFAAIVRTYAEYQKKKLLTDGKVIAGENQLSVRDVNAKGSSKNNNEMDCKNINYKFTSDEFDYRDPEVYPYRKKQYTDGSDIPFSQFKDNLKEETSSKLIFKQKDKYDEFVLQETSETDGHVSTIKPHDSQDCFVKISKYDKNDSIDVVYEKTKDATKVYKYDEKLGYQHPFGKSAKSKINLHRAQFKKGKFYKVGRSVYSDDGEFLYRVPF